MRKLISFLTLLFVGISANAQFTPSNNLNYVKLLKVPPAGAVEDSVLVYDGSDSFVKMRTASSMPVSTPTQTALDLKLSKTNEDFNYSVDFDPLLSQDPLNLTVKKRDLQPESSHLDPAYIPIFAWGDSMTEGYTASPFPTPYPAQLATLLGYTVTNKGVGGENSTQIRARMIADTGSYSKSVIIWAGRNNFSDPTTVKADIAAMITALGHTRYLVLGILNSANGYIGTLQHTQILSLNADLKAIYGSKYVPIREAIIAGYNSSIPQDVTDHNNDVPPTSLRVPGDPLHLNTAGNELVAKELYKRLGILYNQNGYLQSKDIEYYINKSNSVIHMTGNETIAGVKTFSSSPIVPTATTSGQAVNKGQLDLKQNIITNPVTGTGASGQIPYWTGTNTQTGSADFQYNSANKRFGINVFSTPQATIDARSEGTEKLLNITLYSNTLTAGAMLQALRVGGTKAIPTATLANTLLGGLTSAGYDGVAAGGLVANVKMWSKQDYTTSNQPSFIDFETTPVSSIVSAVRVRIDSDGRTLFGTTTNNGVDVAQFNGSVSAATDATTSGQLVRKGQMDAADALKASLVSPDLTGTPTAPTATAGTNTTQIATTSFVTSAVSTAVSGKKSFIYNFDHIELTNTASTYFMKPLTGLVYSDNKATADYTVLKTLTWNKAAFIAPYKCRLKKAIFGTNGGVYLYVGGSLASVKSDIYNRYNGGTGIYVDNVDITVEANTLIYLAFRTVSTGQSIMEGTLYFEEF
jgi:lysophospholipase L1-like esterase